VSVVEKRCCTCKQVRPADAFHKLKSSKTGLAHRCKDCAARARAAWYATHKEEQKAKGREWAARNRGLFRAYNKKRRETHGDEVRAYHRAWRKRTGYAVAWLKAKEQKDPVFRLNRKLSKNIHDSLRCPNARGRRLRTIVGYGIKELRQHLEARFTEEMNWSNYGTYWHIDHVVPKSWFKYESVEDEAFKKCWSLDNLQPLEARANASKGARFAG
jgi:hypothetical protein